MREQYHTSCIMLLFSQVIIFLICRRPFNHHSRIPIPFSLVSAHRFPAHTINFQRTTEHAFPSQTIYFWRATEHAFGNHGSGDKNYPDTMGSMADLAVTYYQQGRSNEAEEILVEYCSCEKKCSARSIPTRLRVYRACCQQSRTSGDEQISVRKLFERVHGHVEIENIIRPKDLA